jgi:hypothetical protein
MSRLLEEMRDYVVMNGMSGKADLCKATNRGMRSVELWLSGDFHPSDQVRYQVALVVRKGNEQEALQLAKESASEAQEAG